MKLSELTSANFPTLSTQEIKEVTEEMLRWLWTESSRRPKQKKYPCQVEVGHLLLTIRLCQACQAHVGPHKETLDNILQVLDKIYQTGYVHGTEDIQLLVGRG